MRINKFIALASGMSRRTADAAIAQGNVLVNGQPPSTGHQVSATDIVMLNGKPLTVHEMTTLIFNKPVGYVVSRDGQGSETIYRLLPPEFSHLKPVGRLDKASSGLLLLTNDGDLANRLTHPSNQKVKVYEVELFKALEPLHRQMISDYGVQLEDGPSKLQLARLDEENQKSWAVTMREGRNRQIRRTFASLGYTVKKLHRTNFGEFSLDGMKEGEWKQVNGKEVENS